MAPMRRGGLLILGWIVAGLVAIAASRFGVSLIADQVTDNRPPPLSAAEIRDELAVNALQAPPSTDPGAGPTAPTTTIPPPPPSTPGPNDHQPPAAPGAAQVLTHQAIGGTVTLRYAPEGVTVLAATPAAGFTVLTETEHGHELRVTFENDEHRSRITGWWDGQPRTEVREDD